MPGEEEAVLAGSRHDHLMPLALEALLEGANNFELVLGERIRRPSVALPNVRPPSAPSPDMFSDKKVRNSSVAAVMCRP